MRKLRRGCAVLLAVLAVGALVLTGCTPRSGSAAAYVDGTPISATELNRVAAGVATYLDPSTAVSKPGVLAVLVRGRLADAVASRRGIAITDGERDQFIAQQAKVNSEYKSYQAFLTHPDAREVVYATADADLIAQRIGGATELVAAARQVPMEVNPRFGEWVFTDNTMGIRQDSSGSLSKPLPTS